MVKDGQIYKQICFDLNADGNKEIVALRAYNVSDNGDYLGQLVVLNAAGQSIFEGPRPAEIRDPFSFGHYPMGDIDLQAVVSDYDPSGADHIDAIGAMPVTDLRPTPFRVWRWYENKFVPKFCKTLIEEPLNSNYYVWKERDFDYATDRWISKFYYNENGELMGKVIDTTSEERVLIGTAKIIPTETGYGIAEWIELPN